MLNRGVIAVGVVATAALLTSACSVDPEVESFCRDYQEVMTELTDLAGAYNTNPDLFRNSFPSINDRMGELYGNAPNSTLRHAVASTAADWAVLNFDPDQIASFIAMADDAGLASADSVATACDKQGVDISW